MADPKLIIDSIVGEAQCASCRWEESIRVQHPDDPRLERDPENLSAEAYLIDLYIMSGWTRDEFRNLLCKECSAGDYTERIRENRKGIKNNAD